MRASTRLRVSEPTSAHPLTTLDTVITLTLRSRAMSFKRTGGVGALAMWIRAPGRAARCSANGQKREYTNLRQVTWARHVARIAHHAADFARPHERVARQREVPPQAGRPIQVQVGETAIHHRSEEHTSEL